MSELEAWVRAKVHANGPGGDDTKSGAHTAVQRLCNACVVLKGDGGGTLFGLQPPPELTPHPGLYESACKVLTTWFAEMDEEEAAQLARFIRARSLDASIPPRFAEPEPKPEASVDLPSPKAIASIESRLAALTPLWTAAEWNALAEKWKGLERAVLAGGGEVFESFSTAAPAGAAELANVEGALGRPMPESLLRACLVSSAVAFSCEFPNGAPIEAGGYEGGIWHLDDIPGLYEESRAWALDENDAQDRLWVEAIPIAGVDGSYIALDGERVVILDHEGDSTLGHGALLASNLRAFIECWLKCGCPNGADWDALEAFIHEHGLNADSEPAMAFQRWLRAVKNM